MTMLTEPHAPWLRDLNRLFTGEGAVTSFIPSADVLVSADGVTVYMDVPGLSADSLEIELDNDVLTVRGERPFPYSTNGGEAAVRRIAAHPQARGAQAAPRRDQDRQQLVAAARAAGVSALRPAPHAGACTAAGRRHLSLCIGAGPRPLSVSLAFPCPCSRACWSS
jgi:hypothetical protein